MKGIAPIISFVLLMAVIMVGSGAMYYFFAGAVTTPALAVTQTSIQVHKYNSTVLKITNIGVTNTTSLALMNTTAGPCTFTASVVLLPGVTYNCTLAAAASGEIRVWAEGINPAFIYL